MKNEPADCANCTHLVGYVNLWCRNRTAAEHHGTAIPQLIIEWGKPCPYFEEMGRIRKFFANLGII